MARDIRIRAVLDDQATPALRALSASLNQVGQTGAKGISSAIQQAEQQTAQVLQKTGGAGLLPSALMGSAGGAAASQAFTKTSKSIVSQFKTDMTNLTKLSKEQTNFLMTTMSKEIAGNSKSLWKPIFKELQVASKLGYPGYKDKAMLVPALEVLGKQSKSYKQFEHMAQAAMSPSKGIGQVVKDFLNMEVGLRQVGIAAAIAGAQIVIFNKVLSAAATNARDLASAAEKLGMGIENYEELSYAAKRLNVDVGSITSAYHTLNVHALDAVTGNKEAAKTFDALGVSVKEASGQLKDPSRLFTEVIQKLSTIDSVTVRNALAQRAMGRAYQDLVPLINAGAKGMKDLADEGRTLGAVMSEDHVRKLAEVKSSYEKLGAALEGVRNAIAIENTDMANRWLAGLTETAQEATKILSLPWLRMWESAVHYSVIGFKYLETVMKAGGAALGATFISAFAGALLSGAGILKGALSWMLPEGFEKEMQRGIDSLVKLMKGAWANVGDVWKKGMDEIKSEFDKINQIWERTDAATTKPLEKSNKEIAKLLDLLKKLTEAKKTDIDMDWLWVGTFVKISQMQVDADKKAIDALEKRIRLNEEAQQVQRQLFDIQANYAALLDPLEAKRLRIHYQEMDLLTQVEEAYKKNLISYKEMQDAKTAIAETAVAQETAASMESVSGYMSQASDLFSSAVAFSEQIEDNHQKSLDRQADRERRRIEQSIMTEGQKEMALSQLDRQTEARKKKEFESNKAMRLAEAVVNTAAGVTQEFAKEGVYGIITGAVVLAAGLLEVATIAAETYAKGGIVPGNQTQGDRVPARVNSGEMVLTAEQQARLFAMASGQGGGGSVSLTAPIVINAPISEGAVSSLAGSQERQLESLRSMIMELKWRGRMPA